MLGLVLGESYFYRDRNPMYLQPTLTLAFISIALVLAAISLLLASATWLGFGVMVRVRVRVRLSLSSLLLASYFTKVFQISTRSIPLG